ncbi:hypothetical protein ACVWZM_004426 [Bradyrhizobium sp. USDA 4501]
MAVPSATAQPIFSIIGAIAVSITAFVRFTAMTTPESTEAGQGVWLTAPKGAVVGPD